MANYHKKRAARNSTATCTCKMYKKLGNSKERRSHRDQVKLWAKVIDMGRSYLV